VHPVDPQKQNIISRTIRHSEKLDGAESPRNRDDRNQVDAFRSSFRFQWENTAVQTAAAAKNTVVTTVRLPRDVRDWLKQRAVYFGGSPNAELVRCCRAAMEREAAKDRATVAAE